jgi:sorting nexin-41/42
LQDLEQNWQEPLHEYSQFGSIIKKLLAYRHQKHVQLEMTQDALEARRESLTELEKSEREAKRLEQALERGPARSMAAPTPAATEPASPDADAVEEVGANTSSGEEGNQQDENPASVFLPPHPGPSPVRRRAPGLGLLNALSYTIHGMMDADPESARRSGISKTRETISQVAARLMCVMIYG